MMIGSVEQWAHIDLYSLQTYRRDFYPERAWGLFYSPRADGWFIAYGDWDPCRGADEDGVIAKLSTRQVISKDVTGVHRATEAKKRKGYELSTSRLGYRINDGCGLVIDLDRAPHEVIAMFPDVYEQASPTCRSARSTPSTVADPFSQINAPDWF